MSGSAPLKLFFLTGEVSGDQNAADLLAVIKAKEPNLEIQAFGGEKLAAEGAKIRLESTHLGSLGLIEGLKRIIPYWLALRLLKQVFLEFHPHVFIPVDFRAFNVRTLPLAQEAKIPVMYYFAPAVWGVQGVKRFEILKRFNVHALVIFPFLKQFYEMGGVAHTVVGHPLLDKFPPNTRRTDLRKHLGGRNRPLVGLLPGSRNDEVRRLLPVLKEVITARPEWDFLILPARQAYVERFQKELGVDSVSVRIFQGERADFYGGCDALAACSGTATLEAALMGTPTAIIYKVGWLAAQLYKLLVKQQFVGMPNILAEREVAPELLQDGCTPAAILSYLDQWLSDPKAWATASAGVTSVRARLGEAGALNRAADAILARARQEAGGA